VSRGEATSIFEYIEGQRVLRSFLGVKPTDEPIYHITVRSGSLTGGAARNVRPVVGDNLPSHTRFIASHSRTVFPIMFGA